MTELDAGRLYGVARESISDLVRSLSQGRLAAPVPSSPGWTVHDVISHLAGVATDAVNNGDAVPSDEAGARHVADRSDTQTSVVLREWERSSSQFEVLLTKGGQRLPAEVLDVITREHDIRAAVGMPGSRDDEPLRAATSLARRFSGTTDPTSFVDLLCLNGCSPTDIVE